MQPHTKMAEAANLIHAVETFNVTVPERLTNLITAYETLSTAPPIPDTSAAILNAAEAGGLTEAKVAKMCADAMSATAAAEHRITLAQKSNQLFLKRFHANLRDGDANAILDALRPTFDSAAQAVADTLQVVDPSVTDTALAITATPEQLDAWRSLPKHLHTLDRICSIATVFGPHGTFDVVEDLREPGGPMMKGGTRALDDRAVMCTGNTIDGAAAVFGLPHPVGDVRTSPWLRVTPKLHTIDEARERVRAWAEEAWDGLWAVRSKTYSTVNGELVEDTQVNPYRITQPA